MGLSKHTGLKREQRKSCALLWQRMLIRGTHEAAWWVTSAIESCPSRFGSLILLYPIPWQRCISGLMSTHVGCTFRPAVRQSISKEPGPGTEIEGAGALEDPPREPPERAGRKLRRTRKVTMRPHKYSMFKNKCWLDAKKLGSYERYTDCIIVKD